MSKTLIPAVPGFLCFPTSAVGGRKSTERRRLRERECARVGGRRRRLRLADPGGMGDVSAGAREGQGCISGRPAFHLQPRDARHNTRESDRDQVLRRQIAAGRIFVT